MGSKVSLLNSALLVGPEERIEDSDEILSLLLLVASLDAYQVLNAGSLLLQHPVDQEQCESHKLCISADLFHDFKEQSNVLLGSLFLLERFKYMVVVTSEMASLCCSSLMFMNSLNFLVVPKGNI